MATASLSAPHSIPPPASPLRAAGVALPVGLMLVTHNGLE
jgi:hypothetical protein